MTPMSDPVSAMLTDEWERFKKGVRQLQPDQWRRLMEAQGRQTSRPGETKTVNIPGWDDVIQTGPRYAPTPEERDEYYRARRERRAPNISDQARESIERGREIRERIRTSAQPEWQQGWGSILTALDNVEDLASTVSTFGRLALWAAPRIGARFVPFLGWAITASDILNTLSLLGMIATPAYGLLCTGDLAALAAGVPTMLFRRGLKSEIWNAARRNPLGRTARLAARARAVGALPNVFNLLEVAQTTDQFFGYGLSLGAIVGALNEAAASAAILARGGSVQVTPGVFGQLWRTLAGPSLEQVSTPQLILEHQAARVVATAPLVMQHQDLFTTGEHIATLTAYAAAVPIVTAMTARFDWRPALALALEEELAPPVDPSPLTRAGLDADGIQLPTDPRWPIPGAPRRIRGRELVEVLGPRAADATRRFVAKRSTSAEAIYAGTIVGVTTDALWTLYTGSADGLRWELAPDFRLMAGLAEDGYLVNTHTDASTLHAFWRDARSTLADLGSTSLPSTTWRELAQRHGVSLIKLLGPEAAWPPEWAGSRSTD